MNAHSFCMIRGGWDWRGFAFVAACAAALLVAREAAARTIAAEDTLDPPAASSDAVQQRLDRLGYEAGAFDVTTEPHAGSAFDTVVRFPSPVRTGEPAIDTVVLEWRQARRDGERLAEPVPAVVVLHSVQPRLVVGRSIAYQLSQRGLHALVLHLPGYGGRLPEGQRWTPVGAIERGEQAAGDARRAFDAVAALPGVDRDRVSLMGVSLGGFVAATAAALEPDVWHRVWLVASGADIATVLADGKRDAARVARWLSHAGYTGESLRELIEPLDPAPLLHRLHADRTHLVRPVFDRVIPKGSYELLIDKAELPEANVHELPANHYTMLLLLPRLLDTVIDAAGQPR